MKGIRHIVVFFLLAQLGFAQSKKIALINGTAHLGNGKLIESCLIIINEGKIEVVQSIVGVRIDYRAFDTIMDVAGKHIYPALINPNNVLGLHDAEAVRATRDFSEVGTLNPHIRALIAYNTDNQIIPTIKTNGVLYTQATPRGGLISGSSSIMALEGWNWEDAVLKADDGIHLNFPAMVTHSNHRDEKRVKQMEEHYAKSMQQLESFFEEAGSYLRNPANQEKNIRFEAMRGVMSGTSRLYIHVDRSKDMLAAISFVKKFKIQKPVFAGAKESYMITRELRNNNIPVILNRVNDLPDKPDQDVDLVYRLPFLLQKDSVLFCLQMEGDMEAMNSRNLPFNAGSAVAYGLTKEQALSAISLNAAKILGIDERVGSLEEGKLASLVVSEGDILDMRSNKITFALIAGKEVNLENQQSALNKKYKTKYGIK